MARIVCGRCENRHVIETLGAAAFLDALRSSPTKRTVISVTGRSSLQTLRESVRVRAPLALAAPSLELDVIEQLLRTRTEQEK